MVDITYPRPECINAMHGVANEKIEDREKSLALQFQLLKQEMLNEIQRAFSGLETKIITGSREEINWVFKIMNWLMPAIFAVVGMLIYKKIGG